MSTGGWSRVEQWLRPATLPKRNQAASECQPAPGDFENVNPVNPESTTAPSGRTSRPTHREGRQGLEGPKSHPPIVQIVRLGRHDFPAVHLQPIDGYGLWTAWTAWTAFFLSQKKEKGSGAVRGAVQDSVRTWTGKGGGIGRRCHAYNMLTGALRGPGEDRGALRLQCIISGFDWLGD